MALTDESNGLVMPVSPMGGNFGGNGFGFGGDGAWLILFILLACGGWGNGFGGGYGGNQLSYDFPWLLNGQQNVMNGVNQGFDNVALNTQLSGIQNAISTGFSNSEIANCNRAMDSMQTAYTNEIASLERNFASQTANTQGFTNLASQLANCCCENRMATAQTQALVQSENCADRQALSDGIRDVIANQTQGFQRILDQMCSDKIDAKNEKILELQNKLNMADFAASQVSQNNYLQNALTAQTQYFLSLYPRPAETTTTVAPTT